MRTFYIFNINKSFYNLMKNNPYHLYKAMEDIHTFDESDINMAYYLFKQIASPFDKSKINNKIFDITTYRKELSYNNGKPNNILFILFI